MPMISSSECVFTKNVPLYSTSRKTWFPRTIKREWTHEQSWVGWYTESLSKSHTRIFFHPGLEIINKTSGKCTCVYIWEIENMFRVSADWVKAETHDATNRGDKSPRLHCCCDKAAYAILSLRYVARIQTSLNSCDRSQRQWFSHVTRGDLLQQPVAATCRSDLSHRVSQPLSYLAMLDELQASCHAERRRPVFGAKIEA